VPTERAAIGIDYHNGVYHVARVIHGGGRPRIEALVRYEKSQLKDHRLLKGGEVIMAVPDDKVIAKNLYLETVGGVDLDGQSRFEMAQSLLDKDTDFCFDVIDTGIENRYLALAIHRQTLSDEIIDPFNEAAQMSQQPHGLARGVALGKGYVTFCHPHGGELVCLADHADGLLSVCFVLHQHIIGLSYINTDKLDLGTQQGRQTFAIELKTVINFNLGTFFENGITLPLTALQISGERMDDTIISELGRYFTVSVTRPQFNTGFFTELDKADSIPIENYLIALGLVNN